MVTNTVPIPPADRTPKVTVLSVAPLLGEAIARLLEARGHDVQRVCLVNDRGVHIMKSMIAYSKWGAGSTPESESIKGDHFVGNWYVVFAQKVSAERKALALLDEQPTPLEQEAAEWLRKWDTTWRWRHWLL